VRDLFAARNPLGSSCSETNATLYRALDEVMHYIWDPVGVAGIPGARDEYQAHIPEVFRLVLDGQDECAIADHLGHIAVGRMGLQPNRVRDLAAARAAISWRETLVVRARVVAN
jgi:hypothetical protein